MSNKSIASLAPDATNKIPNSMSTSTDIPNTLHTETSSYTSTGNVTMQGDMPIKSGYHDTGHGTYNWAWVIIVFIVLVIIIWLILWAVKPNWVQQTDPSGNCTGEIDNGKAFLWAVAIAIVIVVIIWLIRAAAYAGRVC